MGNHLIAISSHFNEKSEAASWAYKQKQLWQNGYILYLLKVQAKNGLAYIVCRSCIERDYTEPRFTLRAGGYKLLTAIEYAKRFGSLLRYPNKNVSEIKIKP